MTFWPPLCLRPSVAGLEETLVAPMLRKAANQTLLIYNRVPKCGSSTNSNLITRLAIALKYNHMHNITHRPQIDAGQEVSSKLQKFARPTLLSTVYPILL